MGASTCLAQEKPVSPVTKTINAADITSKMKLYPNPVVANWIFINHPQATNKNAQIKILDFNGNAVVAVIVRTKAEQTIINASGLSAGNYVLVYNNGTEQGVLKFRKE